MTEEYLQFIWGVKRFDAINLVTTDNEPISVERFGVHNTLLAGPDFSNAAIRFGDAIIHGPVEIHVKSSDWYKHQHHLDPAYNNVVLHVVFEHDKEIIQNERVLPTLELKSRIDKDHFSTFKQFRKQQHSIICGSQLLETDPIFLQQMIDKALLQKIDAKIKTVTSYMDSPEDGMFYFLAAAFGANLNVYPFLQLVQSVSLPKLRALQPEQRYSWLLLQSGIAVSKEQDFGDKWHFRGTRPGNFPTKRLFQFAHYLCDEQLQLLVELENSADLINAFHQIIESQSKAVRLTTSFKNHILINAIVPYLCYRAQTDQDISFQDRAMEILEIIPTEHNAITKKWESTGWKLKNARESQGLLALHRYYCTAKKCLSCEVGHAILKR